MKKIILASDSNMSHYLLTFRTYLLLSAQVVALALAPQCRN